MFISMQENLSVQRVGLTPENQDSSAISPAPALRSHFSNAFKMWGYDLPSSICTNRCGQVRIISIMSARTIILWPDLYR